MTNARWCGRVFALVVALSTMAAFGLSQMWVDRPGCFSHSNFLHIQTGMSREQVAGLLRSSGDEVKSIPEFPPYVRLDGAPPGWTGVVWGDTFVRWKSGDRDIHVGFTEGRVTSKCYWEPSL